MTIINEDEIIHMALEAGFVEWKQSPWGAPVEAIERFAALVAAHAKAEEREKVLRGEFINSKGDVIYLGTGWKVKE